MNDAGLRQPASPLFSTAFFTPSEASVLSLETLGY